MAINQNALLDVVEGMGNGKAKPTDWTKLYKQTGSFVFTDKGPDGQPINIPFKELMGGISPAFEQFMKEEKAPNEILIPELGWSADYKIENNGSIDEFREKVKALEL